MNVGFTVLFDLYMHLYTYVDFHNEEL